MRLGNRRLAESSLAASSYRNENGTLSGKQTNSCTSFESWKAQNMKKMLILDKNEQHDTLHYSELYGKDSQNSLVKDQAPSSPIILDPSIRITCDSSRFIYLKELAL